MATLPLIAGIISPGLLTVGLFIWQNRWKKDALSLNAFKCGFATIFFGVIVASFSTQQKSSESQYDVTVVGYMMLSSVLGIIVADTWWLIALERIGARRMIAIDAVKPFLALAFGSFVLQDRVGIMAIIGIIFTSLGILLVNLEKREESGSGNDDMIGSSQVNRLHDSSHIMLKHGEILKLLEELQLYQFVDSFPIDGQSSLDEVMNLCNEMSSTQKQSLFTAINSELVDKSTNDPSNQGNFELTTQSPGASTENDSVECDTEAIMQPVAPVEPVDKGSFDVVAYLYALGNVVLDVYAATLIVKWHGSMSSADVNLIRFGFAAVVLISVIGIKRQKIRIFNFIFYDKTSYSFEMSMNDWVAVSCGIVFVTVLTPLINTWVLFKLPLAIAITLNSTSPLWSLPVAHIHNEVISVKAILGALLATGGIVLLILG